MRNDVQGGSQTTGARDMAADGDDTVWLFGRVGWVRLNHLNDSDWHPRACEQRRPPGAGALSHRFHAE
jgi:hypothetical protein